MSNSSQAMLAGALAGAASGVAVGIADGLWSFGAIDQYLPHLGGKLLLVLHLSLSYSLAMGLVGAGLGLLLDLLARTRAPGILTALARGSESKRPASVSLAIVAPPLVAIASSVAYQTALRSLATRKHAGLVILVSMVLAIGALAAAAVGSLLAAGVARRALREREQSWGLTLALGAGSALVGALVVYLVLRGRFAGASFGQVWIALLAYAIVLAIPLALPALLAAIDRERTRELALPLVCTVVPTLALGLAIAFQIASRSAGGQPVLVILHAMSLASIAALVAIGVGTLAARLLEAPLRKLASPRAPLIAALVLAATAATVGVVLWWNTLSLLRLRPFIVGILLLGTGHLLATPMRRPAKRIPGWTALLSIPLLFTGIIATGNPESIQKAQSMHAGLSEPLAQVYRRLGDWDRDGSSRWLGGGDCDDSNPDVNPRADEIPFDGIDNNCLRGDVEVREASATHFAPPPPGLPEDFNVLFLTIDTIRADHLGAYGYERNTTPHMDALAKDGTLFANGWAHAPSTRYSIPALLTGRHPLNVRYRNIPGQWPGLSEENTTIAEIMRERGLHTGAILNYWYFDAHRKMNQGFAHYDNSNKRLHKAVSGEGPSKTSGSSSKEQTDKALEYIGEHAGERFFLWVHYYDPHYDYEKHPEAPVFGNSEIDAYDHEIAYTDHHIGRVIDDLKARGLYEKTVIVITGDHGEGFGEHGIDLHGYHLYAAQTKVPLILRVPGTKPSIVTMPAAHVDVLPTLANLAGAESTTEMLGRSLVGVITGEEDPNQDRFVFQQLSYENNNEYRGAASKQCHVLYNVSPSRSWELYQIDTDPMERRDIINTPGKCEHAREALETWYDYSEIPEGAIEALLDAAPELSDPIDVRFGKSIQLVEAKLPRTIRRGQVASLELTWKAGGKPPRGWKVFAHFEKSPGQKSKAGRFTADHEPMRPFSWWSRGQFIRYEQSLSPGRTQPLGHYDLWFGIYKGNQRMPVAAEGFEVVDRRVKLTTIEVVP